MLRNKFNFLLAVLVLTVAGHVASSFGQTGQYLTSEQLYAQVFPQQESIHWQTLWLKPEQRQAIEKILERSFNAPRIRYWGANGTTVWQFDEIGKEKPITLGVVVTAGKIARLEVMEYRETRGGEIRHPFFTRQFIDLTLAQNQRGYHLNGTIDGVTGATLSVRAVKKIATLALYCHQQTPFYSASD